MVSGWVVEYVLRQPDIPDPIINRILTHLLLLPLPPPSFSLYNSLLLRRLQSETTVSPNILDLLELSEEIRHVAGFPVTESMRTAYRLVAEQCGVWEDRVGGMMMGGDGCGLITEAERERLREKKRRIKRGEEEATREEREKKRRIERWREKDAVWEKRESGKRRREEMRENGDGIGEEREGEKRREKDVVGEKRESEKHRKEEMRENEDGIGAERGEEKRREERRENGAEEEDAMGAVRAYVAEAWEELGPSFLEVVAGIFGVVELESEGITKDVVRSENNQVLHQHSMNNDGNNVSQLPRRKIVAKKFSRGAKITETEQIKNRDLLKRYDCVSTPAYDKLQEALTTSSLELQDVVKDSLPEEFQFAERVVSSNKKDNMASTNNASKPSIMLRNSTACTDEWGDSIENFTEGDSDIRRSRIKLPLPKNIVVSPLKEHVMKNCVGRRTIRKWSVIEEVTLRTGVEKYGKGWMTILDSYPDIFKDRTDCDLKDKWRNMTQYSH